jgi:NIMA-interacting peptidyl-prolyl cis-trans isomerase 1
MQGSSSAPSQVRASHLLVKHAGSRRPSSWKEATVTRSQEEAAAMVQQFRDQLAASPDLPAAFAALATRESHCGSARSGGDLDWFGCVGVWAWGWV